jgi:hypothetical protein
MVVSRYSITGVELRGLCHLRDTNTAVLVDCSDKPHGLLACCVILPDASQPEG